MNEVMWNPWHGCHKVSEGCANCWMYQQDEKYDRNPSNVTRSSTDFNRPVKLNRYMQYKDPANTLYRVCFTSDFFIEEADVWRPHIWSMMKCRSDCTFLLLTKRVNRVRMCLPLDWHEGYTNVILAVSCENQVRFNERASVLVTLPFAKKLVFASPLLGELDLSQYIKDIDGVYVGGENWNGARPCHYEWVLSMYNQCVEANTHFDFWSTGSNFYKDGKHYHIGSAATQKQQAKKSGLQFRGTYEEFNS